MSEERTRMPAETPGEDGLGLSADGLDRRIAEREVRIRRAHEVAAEAVTVPPAERQAWVESQPDCLCPEFVELMIAMARERRSDDADEATGFAHLAVTAAETYTKIGGTDADNARALAWAELGNCHRIRGDLRSSGKCFVHARERLRYATDPLIRAEVFSLEASYRDHKSEFPEAEKLLVQAERIARRVGTRTLVGKLQLQRADVTRSLGRLAEAIGLLSSSLGLINPRTEPKLALTGLHNLAHYLILAGRPSTGRKMLRRLRPAYLAFGNEVLSARSEWLEAIACVRLGELEQGENLLEDARAKMAELGSMYEATLIGLDLADLFAETGRWTEVGELAQETLELCRGIGVTTEVIAAATLLVQAAARRQSGVQEALSLLRTLRQMLAPRDSAGRG